MVDQLKSFLRISQVKAATGMSKSWIYDAIRRRDFPGSFPVGQRAVAWDADEIARWQKSRVQDIKGKAK